MDRSKKRVVITGVGVISPIGCRADELWQAVTTCRSGLTRPPAELPTDVLPLRAVGVASQFTGSIKDFGEMDKEAQKNLRKALKVMCRECQMGVAVGQLALNDSGVSPGVYEPERIGTSFGSDYMVSEPQEFLEGIKACLDGDGAFHFSRWSAEGMPRLFPLWLLKYLPNMPASHLSIYNDLRGPSNSITLREASANACLMDAVNIIRGDRADCVVAGVTGTRLSLMKALHTIQQEEVVLGEGEPTTASRPFDRDREGMVPGEGAAAVVLEKAESALRRGVRIYGELLSATSVAVAARYSIGQRKEALIFAAREALKLAGLTPSDVGFVMAHGLGTHTCDQEEAEALEAVFGPQGVPVIAAKSYFGNLGAGAGMVELVLGLLVLEHGTLFPTINCDHIDPACPVDVVRESRDLKKPVFLNLNVTPQGQASAAVVTKFSG